MARYIDEKDVYKLIEPSGVARVHCSQIDELPRADVVPKSEVEKIFEEIESCMKDFEDDDDGYLLKKCEFEFFMREIRDKYTENENG